MDSGHRFLPGCLLIQIIFLLAGPCSAEELDPKRWTHLPINTNFAGIAYAYTEADIGFDPVLKLEDVEMEMHTWGARYIRTFELFDKTARISFLQGLQEGHWSGLLEDVPKTANRSGLSDTLMRFAISLYGAPPLQGKEYRAYRAATEVETIVGAGVSVQLPTGDYRDDRLINLGTNRFSFRPQLGIVHNRGKWSTELTGTVELFADNNDFFNGQTLEQDPLYIIHGHLVYTFRPGLWASASAGYDYGGRSTVNGTRKDDRKQNLAWKFSIGIPVNRQVGITLAYIGFRTRVSTGTDSDTLTMAVSTFW